VTFRSKPQRRRSCLRCKEFADLFVPIIPAGARYANHFRAPRSSVETLQLSASGPEMRRRPVSACGSRSRRGKRNDAARRRGIDCSQLFSASHTRRLRAVVSFVTSATSHGLRRTLRRRVQEERDLAEPGSAEAMVFAIRVEYGGLSPRCAQKVEIDVGNTMFRLG